MAAYAFGSSRYSYPDLDDEWGTVLKGSSLTTGILNLTMATQPPYNGVVALLKYAWPLNPPGHTENTCTVPVTRGQPMTRPKGERRGFCE